MSQIKNLFAAAIISAVLVTASRTAFAQAAVTGRPTGVSHQRLLPLEGGQNFRDLGGYRTADGRTVKWNILFRSGSMHALTARDFDYLAKIGIRTVCDFRDTTERAREPVAWPTAQAPNILADDYRLDLGPVMQALRTPGVTGPQARATLARLSRTLPFDFAGQYRRMFAQLLAGNVPLAFNCSAGKDRTGVAAALLLTALGVPRETVIQDYLLSNRYVKPPALTGNDPTSTFLRSLPHDVLSALTGVDRSYIEAVFSSIESKPGGLKSYFRNDLSLGDDQIERLRDMYLQR